MKNNIKDKTFRLKKYYLNIKITSVENYIQFKVKEKNILLIFKFSKLKKI